MEPDPAADTFDRDLDVPKRRWDAPPLDSIFAYQRLVANPLLAVLGWIVLAGLIRMSLYLRNLPLLLISLTLLILPFFLIQYHCLDCGMTGWFIRYRYHGCAAVLERWRSDEPPRPRGLSLPRQVGAWFLFLTMCILLYLILFKSA